MNTIQSLHFNIWASHTSCIMSTNVLQLGEVADFEALTFNLALNFF